jgi:hypothetical protein
MDIKAGKPFRVPVRLLSPSGLAITGTLYSALTCSIQKQDESMVTKTVTSGSWYEIDPDRFPGLYDLQLLNTETNRPGFLKYSVSASGTTLYVGVVEVSRWTIPDIIDILGTPLTTIARDIIEAGRLTTDSNIRMKKKGR